jgi:hypothetical protein
VQVGGSVTGLDASLSHPHTSSLITRTVHTRSEMFFYIHEMVMKEIPIPELQ